MLLERGWLCGLPSGAQSLVSDTTWRGLCKRPWWAENWGNLLSAQLVPLLLAYSMLLAFSVLASDSFICATSISQEDEPCVRPG